MENPLEGIGESLKETLKSPTGRYVLIGLVGLVIVVAYMSTRKRSGDNSVPVTGSTGYGVGGSVSGGGSTTTTGPTLAEQLGFQSAAYDLQLSALNKRLEIEDASANRELERDKNLTQFNSDVSNNTGIREQILAFANDSHLFDLSKAIDNARYDSSRRDTAAAAADRDANYNWLFNPITTAIDAVTGRPSNPSKLTRDGATGGGSVTLTTDEKWFDQNSDGTLSDLEKRDQFRYGFNAPSGMFFQPATAKNRFDTLYNAENRGNVDNFNQGQLVTATGEWLDRSGANTQAAGQQRIINAQNKPKATTLGSFFDGIVSTARDAAAAYAGSWTNQQIGGGAKVPKPKTMNGGGVIVNASPNVWGTSLDPPNDGRPRP